MVSGQSVAKVEKGEVKQSKTDPKLNELDDLDLAFSDVMY